jgi:hypothetical protein
MDADDEIGQVECSECGSAQVIGVPSGTGREGGWGVMCGACCALTDYAVSPSFRWYPDESGFTADYVPEDHEIEP